MVLLWYLLNFSSCLIIIIDSINEQKYDINKKKIIIHKMILKILYLFSLWKLSIKLHFSFRKSQTE